MFLCLFAETEKKYIMSALGHNIAHNISHLGQAIQEWSKLNLLKAAFEKFEVIWSA